MKQLLFFLFLCATLTFVASCTIPGQMPGMAGLSDNDKVMHNVGEVNLLGHKLRILENFVTEYLLFHTIESVVLPVCSGADTPKLDS